MEKRHIYSDRETALCAELVAGEPFTAADFCRLGDAHGFSSLKSYTLLKHLRADELLASGCPLSGPGGTPVYVLVCHAEPL